MNGETVFSVLTPTGRGAVAVVAVDGPQAVATVDQFFHARNRRSLTQQSIGQIIYGHWGGEDLVVCRRGADRVEIHCHGGSQSATAIARDLSSAGCVDMPWQVWVGRQHDCPIRTAAQLALAEAASARAAAILLDQFHGALRKELEQIVALVSDRKREAPERLGSLASTAEFGLHLTRPWQVVVVGRPNVGKSSLINALVGYERAIVFDQPGTTRDVVTASTVIDGWPVSLSDTAGLHAATDELEVAGIELVRQRLSSADLVVWVLDAIQVSADSLQVEVDRQVKELGLTFSDKRLLVVNKIDLKKSVEIPESAIGTCAISGAGIERLLAAISKVLVPNVPSAGSAVLFTPAQEQAVAAALAATNRGDFAEAASMLGPLSGSVCGE